jgi:Putative prokaryotic signal transducing protein
MQHRKLVRVHTRATRPEAELAKGEFEAAGIPSMIQSDSVGGMRDHLARSGQGFRILVREQDEATAREVLTTPADEFLDGDESRR